MSKLRWLLICLLSLTLRPAESIRGTVTDASGGVLRDVTVQLLSDDRVIAETKTTATGNYALTSDCSPAGSETYTVRALASGFAPARRTAQLGVGDLTLVLEVAPYRQSVEITAAAPRELAILDMSGVRESAAKDLGEALTAIDGVWKIRKAGIANDVVVRGFQQNNINVLVDGTRTFAACPGHMDPPAQHVDFAEIDHVEVTKGAFDVTNQGSLGAVVNIVTKAPGMGFDLKPSFSAASFGYYNPSVTASYGNRRLRVLSGYSYRSSDPYKDASGHRLTDYAAYSAVGKQQRGFEINSVWLEAQISLTGRQQVSLAYARQQSGLILYPYLTMDSDYDNADRASFKYSARDLGGALRGLRVEGYFTQVKHFMSDSQRTSAMMGSWMMASDASTRTIGGRVETDLGHDMTAGVESYNRNWNVTGYNRKSGMVNPLVPDVNTQTVGAFVNYRHDLTERVKLTGGLRFDHARMRVEKSQASTNLYYQFHNTRRAGNHDNYASGNVRLSRGLARWMELFAGIGTAGRIPDAEERYVSRPMAPATVGNPLLPISRNTEVSGGWSLNLTRFYLRPAFFYSFLNNYILLNNQPQMNAVGVTTGVTARSYANVDARVYGGEMQWGVTLTQWLSLNGGGSYSRGTTTPQPGINVLSGNLPEMPPLRAWTSLRYAHR